MSFDKKWMLIMVVLGMVATSGLVLAITAPEGPGILATVDTTRRIPATAPTDEAEAGNITHLTVYGKTVTQSWQGYVGNITGLVVLQDVNNMTLYNWSISDPRGEIYATYLSSVEWETGKVTCWNWSFTSDDPNYLDLGELEGWNDDAWAATTKKLGCSAIDVDCVNETFSTAYPHNAFYVGGQLIQQNTCAAVGLFNQTNQTFFQEVLLYDNKTTDDDGIIYTAILEQNKPGYDAGTWDFEMIVGEDGHNGSITSTTYYFYVELN